VLAVLTRAISRGSGKPARKRSAATIRVKFQGDLTDVRVRGVLG
jgi:hypothetical protein